MWVWFVRMRIKSIQTLKYFDVGMEEQKQELGWRVSVLPIPAFHHCEPLCVARTQCTVECMQEWVIQILFLFFFHPYI